MATISRMAINLAWDGQEAEAGLNKTAHLLKSTGIAALDAANNFSKSIQDRVKNLGLSDSEIRSLTKLSELDKERAIDRMEEEANLRRMSKNSQLLYEQMVRGAEEAAAAEAKVKAQQEARAKQLAGLSALDKQRLFDREARQQKILGMTAKQQLAFEAQEKAAEKARAKAEAWADMSWIQKIKKSLQGAQDIKATIEMVRGLFRLLAAGPMAAARGVGGAIGLGAELETMQIQMGALVKNFDKGAQSLEVLRQITRDMGVPLKDLVGAFSQLVGAGIGGGDAEKLLRTFSAIAPLLGQGGLSQLSGSIANMAKTGLAESSALQQMQSGGLQVYEALATKLTNITGVLHSVKDAQAAVERGAVLASTAISAMQEAAQSPQALEAAQRISNSVEGQLARLKQGFTELLRDIGYGMIRGLDIPALLASARGVLEAAQLITQQIVNSLTALAGPGGQGGDLEASFKRMRDIAFSMGEFLAKVFNDAREFFEILLRKLESIMWKGGEIAKGGITGLASGKSTKGFYWEDQLLTAELKAISENSKQRGAGIEKFFASARAGAVWLDMQRKADQMPQAPGVGGGIAVPAPFNPVSDAFQSLRDLQSRMRQGEVLAGSKVSEAFNAIIAKGQVDPNGWMAGKLEAGTTAAVDAIMAHQYGKDSRSLQEQIVDGIKATEEQARRQTDLEREMVELLKKLRLPAVGVLPK